MKKLLLSFTILAAFYAFAAADAVENWNDFEHQLRRGTITSAEAELNAVKLVENLSKQFGNFTGESAARVFPIAGYTSSNISNYDKLLKQLILKQSDTGFFDGEKFATGEYLKFKVTDIKAAEKGYADIVAVADSIVLFVKKGAFSNAGSGNYVWLYNPHQNTFYYYGYLKDVFVKSGQHVKAGEKIATVRAAKKGFALNFTVLTFERDNFIIYNYLDELP
jgi:murein DD-endopeptidase MepM/ murein hydrolase activator NlpD